MLLLPDALQSSSIFATMGSFTAPSASCCSGSYMFVVLPGGLPNATNPQKHMRPAFRKSIEQDEVRVYEAL